MPRTATRKRKPTVYTPTVIDKRVVLKTMTGARAGLHAIHGVVSALKTAYKGQLPGRVDGVSFFDHKATAVHAGEKPRYVLYQEYLNVDGKSPDLNPAQR